MNPLLRLRKICLALPGAEEVETWGHPTFRVNVGKAAGQNRMHVHVHLIPRYSGDVPDPKGGVRRVLEGKSR